MSIFYGEECIALISSEDRPYFVHKDEIEDLIVKLFQAYQHYNKDVSGMTLGGTKLKESEDE